MSNNAVDASQIYGNEKLPGYQAKYASSASGASRIANEMTPHLDFVWLFVRENYMSELKSKC